VWTELRQKNQITGCKDEAKIRRPNDSLALDHLKNFILSVMQMSRWPETGRSGIVKYGELPPNVRDAMLNDAARSIDTGREVISSEDTPIPTSVDGGEPSAAVMPGVLAACPVASTRVQAGRSRCNRDRTAITAAFQVDACPDNAMPGSRRRRAVEHGTTVHLRC
jgi:hypothetical protein